MQKKNSDVYTFLGYIDIYLLVVQNKNGVQQQSNLKLVPNIFPHKNSPFSTRTSPPQKNPQRLRRPRRTDAAETAIDAARDFLAAAKEQVVEGRDGDPPKATVLIAGLLKGN